MQGTAGTAGDPNAKDPVDKMSSRVQCVACFFPPTDFLNYGDAGKAAGATTLLKEDRLKDFRAPFQFTEWDANQKIFVKVTDEKRMQDIARDISPIYHISKDTPPTLIIHGDADTLVPLQQSQSFIDKLKATGVPCELVVKKGGGHGWPTLGQDLPTLGAWFDKYLKK
jgi:acetyl esterase/lipase